MKFILLLSLWVCFSPVVLWAAKSESKSCVLSLSVKQKKWVSEQTRQLDSPFDFTIRRFQTAQLDMWGFIQALNIKIKALQPKAKFQIQTKEESFYISLEEKFSTRKVFVRRYVTGQLAGQLQFSYPSDVKYLNGNPEVEAIVKSSVTIQSEVFISDVETARNFLALFFGSDSPWIEKFEKASVMSSLAGQEFLKAAHVIEKLNKAVAKVDLAPKPIRKELGAHAHEIYMANLTRAIPSKLMSFIIPSKMKSVRQALVIHDLHSDRLTLVDAEALADGRLNIYRESKEGVGTIVHLQTNTQGQIIGPIAYFDDLLFAISLLDEGL